MKKTEKHMRHAHHGRRLLAGAALVLTGATLAAVGTSLVTGPAGAAESKNAAVNFVRAANPDAVAGVLLDEEVNIQFAAPVLPSSVGPDTILVRTGINNGEQARGRYVVGSFMYDKSTQRRAVIRPEALREYYQLVRGLPREDAERSASKLLKRIESTGQLSLLKTVDQKLRAIMQDNHAGTRLDDDSEQTATYGIYPAPLADSTNDNDDPLTFDQGDDELEPYRTRIAGDDALWQAYLVGGDLGAYAELSQNSEYERFYHPVDPATGLPSDTSVLRQREYRRVLINRKGGTRVMFVPDLPIRTDIADTAYTPGRAYALIIPAAQPGVFNTVLTRQGQRPLLQKDGRDFSTHFMTVPANNVALFRDGESRSGISALQKPRVINQTPPNGESFVDPTTDWEDPDNQFTVPIPARRTFSIRLRFAQPLDPRTVSPTSFTVTKKATLDAVGNETPVNVPVAVGTFLNQHRLGIVEVEITPATNLDPQSKYLVTARNLVRSLGGESNPIDIETSFIVGPGQPPLDAVRESFQNSANRADPSNPDTLGQITTAYWPAPIPTYDPDSDGRLSASFMQFAGTGAGAPSDPRDPGSTHVTELTLTAGQGITFVTENVNPATPELLGTPIEYNYTNVSLTNATVTATGRFPLVIRSQHSIDVVSSFINVAGLSGRDGHTNTDLDTGGPTGGLGGLPGVGGYRGGDGACSPLTNALGVAILDANGNLQFDQSKFNGRDGFPSYLFANGATGGGSGGFSGNREAPNDIHCAGAPGVNQDDVPCTPARIREAGGGGGHATAGGLGAGGGGSTKAHTGGYFGGQGGSTYGNSDFREQPKNGLHGTVGVPRLTFGSGGAGGGGGGAEDGYSVGVSYAADGVANASDSGGAGGGGGGGAVQLVARTRILVDSSVIDASGGRGGRTFDQANADYGFGAPGGCGAGGSIWLTCYGNALKAGTLEEGVIVQNGSTITAAGGDNSTSIGYITVKADNTNPLLAGKQEGKGGLGGDGYVRFEDSDGAALIPDYQPDNTISGGTHVKGVLTQGTFAPYDNPGTAAVEADFQAFPNTPFVVNVSRGYSRWFNAQLDTPSFAPHDDDPLTPIVEGTKYSEPLVGGIAPTDVQIWVRSAPNDTANTGHPNLNLATSSGNVAPWTDYLDCGTISRRRFIQFRVDFTVPLSWDWNIAELPFVDFIRIDINLN